MIFTADRSELTAIISRAAQGLPSRPEQPVYAGMLLEADADALAVTASDGQSRFTASGACKPEAPGSCIVPGGMFTDILRYLGGTEVACEYEDGLMRITSGRSRFTLRAAPGNAYPVWARDPYPLCQLDGEELAAAFRFTASAATSTGNPVLSAVCTEIENESLLLAATDHSRLAVSRIALNALSLRAEATDPGAALLPSRTAVRFARDSQGPVSLGWDESLICLGTEGLKVAARQLDGKFPPWRNPLKKIPYERYGTDPAELARAVRMAQLAAGPDDRVTLAFGDGQVIVSAGEEGNECREPVPCQYPGEERTFIIGATYLLDGLAGCGDNVQVAFTQPPAPLFLLSDGNTYSIQPRREL